MTDPTRATKKETLFEEVARAAERVAAEIAEGPIVPAVTPQEIRDHLSSRYDFQEPLDLNAIGADIEQMLRKWQVHVTHPRYLGLFNPSVTPASVVADTLVALYNPQLATWRTSPAANEIERHTLRWLAGKFGMPASSAANFTVGGAEANLSAVIVALSRAFPEWAEGGARALTATPAIYLSAEAHHVFDRIVRIVGLGRRSLRTVAIGEDLRMDLNDLARQVANDRNNGFAPLLVVGTAGTTAAGAIDPLPEIERFCRAEDLWFHVDAAWGGGAILSPKLKGYLEGIGSADSITCDAHKWFSVPMGAGMFFCRHSDAVRKAFGADIDYMPGPTGAETSDPYTTSLQWSRRFIGLKLFFSLAHRGESGYIEMIEGQAEMANRLRESLRRSGWRVVNRTPLPLVCFDREGLDVPEFVANLLKRQIAWMSTVRLHGRTVVRACVTSFRTNESDIERIVREMDRLASHEESKLAGTAPAHA